MWNIKKKTVKEVKMHIFLVCTYKSQDFAQNLKLFARSHDRETVTFRNSAWQPNRTILTSSVKAIMKAMTDTVFWGPSLGEGQNLLFTVGGFFNNRECSGDEWLDHFWQNQILLLSPHSSYKVLTKFLQCFTWC